MVTLDQMISILQAAKANGVPGNTELKYRPLSGSDVELQNDFKALMGDMEIYDSSSGVVVNQITPNLGVMLQQ